MNELHEKSIAVLKSQGFELGEFGVWHCGDYGKTPGIMLASNADNSQLLMNLMNLDGTVFSVSTYGENRATTILKSWCYLIKAIATP